MARLPPPPTEADLAENDDDTGRSPFIDDDDDDPANQSVISSGTHEKKMSLVLDVDETLISVKRCFDEVFVGDKVWVRQTLQTEDWLIGEIIETCKVFTIENEDGEILEQSHVEKADSEMDEESLDDGDDSSLFAHRSETSPSATKGGIKKPPLFIDIDDTIPMTRPAYPGQTARVVESSTVRIVVKYFPKPSRHHDTETECECIKQSFDVDYPELIGDLRYLRRFSIENGPFFSQHRHNKVSQHPQTSSNYSLPRTTSASLSTLSLPHFGNSHQLYHKIKTLAKYAPIEFIWNDFYLVRFRPRILEFFQLMSNYYRIILWTAAVRDVYDGLIEKVHEKLIRMTKGCVNIHQINFDRIEKPPPYKELWEDIKKRHSSDYDLMESDNEMSEDEDGQNRPAESDEKERVIHPESDDTTEKSERISKKSRRRALNKDTCDRFWEKSDVFFRDNCTFNRDCILKDIRNLVGVKLHSCVIVDNLPQNFRVFNENTLPIPDFWGNHDDQQLHLFGNIVFRSAIQFYANQEKASNIAGGPPPKSPNLIPDVRIWLHDIAYRMNMDLGHKISEMIERNTLLVTQLDNIERINLKKMREYEELQRRRNCRQSSSSSSSSSSSITGGTAFSSSDAGGASPNADDRHRRKSMERGYIAQKYTHTRNRPRITPMSPYKRVPDEAYSTDTEEFYDKMNTHTYEVPRRNMRDRSFQRKESLVENDGYDPVVLEEDMSHHPSVFESPPPITDLDVIRMTPPYVAIGPPPGIGIGKFENQNQIEIHHPLESVSPANGRGRAPTTPQNPHPPRVYTSTDQKEHHPQTQPESLTTTQSISNEFEYDQSSFHSIQYNPSAVLQPWHNHFDPRMFENGFNQSIPIDDGTTPSLPPPSRPSRPPQPPSMADYRQPPCCNTPARKKTPRKSYKSVVLANPHHPRHRVNVNPRPRIFTSPPKPRSGSLFIGSHHPFYNHHSFRS